MELAIILTITALFIVGALTPRMETRPWQGGFVLFAEPEHAIRIVHRVWATWRVDRLNHRKMLTQHFQVFKGSAPLSEIRKIL